MALSPKRVLQRTNRFARDLKPLPDNIKRAAFEVAQAIQRNIFAKELDIRPLTGFKGCFRVVVSNEYRMIFSYDDKNIYLRRIAHRKDIYRNLEL